MNNVQIYSRLRRCEQCTDIFQIKRCEQCTDIFQIKDGDENNVQIYSRLKM